MSIASPSSCRHTPIIQRDCCNWPWSSRVPEGKPFPIPSYPPSYPHPPLSSGNSMDRAVDFVRRSLYCCEMAFIEAFKPAQADAKMDLFLPENRPFLSSLLRHMQMSNMLGTFPLLVSLRSYYTSSQRLATHPIHTSYLIHKQNVILSIHPINTPNIAQYPPHPGCPSVSVEVGKVLLSLAPHPGDDPYGVLLALDFYLLSAGKYSEVFAFAGLTLIR